MRCGISIGWQWKTWRGCCEAKGKNGLSFGVHYCARGGEPSVFRNGGLTVNFGAATLRTLRNMLAGDAEKDRFDFAFTMRRWKFLVKEDRDASKRREFVPIDDLDELVAYMCNIPRDAVDLEGDEPTIRARGRPRVDFERYAALLLAVIFQEYTQHKPTQITRSDAMPTDRANTFARDKTSPFYRFATACFDAIGLKGSEDAFREATERWEQSTDFSKHEIQKLIWGRLPAFNNRSNALDVACNTKPLRPRSKQVAESPPRQHRKSGAKSKL